MALSQHNYQGDGVAHPTRVVAYEKAMAGVAERNPDDHEAAIFHALAILGVAYNSPPEAEHALARAVATKGVVSDAEAAVERTL